MIQQIVSVVSVTGMMVWQGMPVTMGVPGGMINAGVREVVKMGVLRRAMAGMIVIATPVGVLALVVVVFRPMRVRVGFVVVGMRMIERNMGGHAQRVDEGERGDERVFDPSVHAESIRGLARGDQRAGARQPHWVQDATVGRRVRI